MKQGPLYDAARMLRIAAKRCEQYANADADATIDHVEHVRQTGQKLLREATANIDAALARIASYRS